MSFDFPDTVRTYAKNRKVCVQGCPSYSAGLHHEDGARGFYHTCGGLFPLTVSNAIITIVSSAAAQERMFRRTQRTPSLIPTSDNLLAPTFPECQPARSTPACTGAARRSKPMQCSSSGGDERCTRLLSSCFADGSRDGVTGLYEERSEAHQLG